MQLTEYLKEKKQLINQQLELYVRDYSVPGRLQDSILHSVHAGGKRLRPILLLATAQAFEVQEEKVLGVASALEMVHTYSLIHDDLPAMDNDDLRRGKPTNHKRFDEATAILAGDALLTLSMQVIAEDPHLSDSERIYLIQELSKASGAKGMVEGQMQDMLSENVEVSLEKLENIHKNKTGQLLKFSILTGAYLGGVTDKVLTEMIKMAEALGLIFQIQDDILDITGDASVIGKPTGSDEGNHKSTYPQLLGLEGAIDQKEKYVQRALENLKNANIEGSTLSQLIQYLSIRDH
ncbi:farnesyl-diphosphate synthase [Halobacillus karajensis]|uniref:Farnesyl diphosphate synthase n=1 Tax=Halobacillus karajensis TaxID=195088 RepID=A0A024P7H3_9BACI|nr:farnesyl diphosphate synthase [Halobacillus karajensis]CDQ17891.1 Farnesyl diphosphate synthase [Halobacillus karajensis]CDQ24297.1 Farnesyl diphosphate synthase [Halobacillus karajensis]CDQ29454.1 Farnesyl diphosphate synthase [Halobacillus karajensis]SEH62152.1 farnesyl-diphosphate synthase [Halobacillus karajensis]